MPLSPNRKPPDKPPDIPDSVTHITDYEPKAFWSSVETDQAVASYYRELLLGSDHHKSINLQNFQHGISSPFVAASLPFWFRVIDIWEVRTDKPPWLKTLKNALEFGIQAEFVDVPPPPVHLKNAKTALDNAKLCGERLRVQRDLGALQRLTSAAYSIQPLHAVVRDGKKTRLVVDLSRSLNPTIRNIPLKYETVAQYSRRLRRGSWLAKVDIRACFLSFPLHPSLAKHISVKWGGVEWGYTKLPFGLNISPAWASRLLSVTSFALHLMGVSHSRYLDDYCTDAHSRAECRHNLDILYRVLSKFGLVLASEKTQGPDQILEYLGIIIDTIRMILRLSEKRLQECRRLLRWFIAASRTTVAKLRSFIGKLSFMSQVLPASRPFIRFWIDGLCEKPRKDRIRINSDMTRDASLWLDRLKRWNGTCKWRSKQLLVIETDASFEGFGIHITRVQGVRGLPEWLRAGRKIAGTWPAELQTKFVKEKNMCWCELYTILFALALVAPFAAEGEILFHCDNLPDVNILNRMSTRSSSLRVLLRAIATLSFEFRSSYKAVHIPGVLNVTADRLSRPSLHKYQFDSNTSLMSARLVQLKEDAALISTSLSSSKSLSMRGFDITHRGITSPCKTGTHGFVALAA